MIDLYTEEYINKNNTEQNRTDTLVFQPLLCEMLQLLKQTSVSHQVQLASVTSVHKIGRNYKGQNINAW